MDFDQDPLNTHDYARAVRDLDRITRDIATRYIVQGVRLTWRLLLAIEAEAVADLGFAGRHEATLRALFEHPSEFAFPETDEFVDFSSSNALPPVFAFAVDAYESAARNGHPELAVTTSAAH